VLRLDEIRDPEMLRQVAVLLERENEKVHAKIQHLLTELARVRGSAAVSAQHELDAADRTCPHCGGTLTEMPGQTEDADEIDVVERRFALVKHRRQKYRCACNGCIDTAPGPLRLATRPDVRGRRYSLAFAVEVAVNKYVDHLPLERQARVMSREGLTIESQTLWDHLDALATVLHRRTTPSAGTCWPRP
jgi:transposase